MTEATHPFFPVDFLTQYWTAGTEESMQRFQTYTVYRFLSAAAKKDNEIVTKLYDTLECEFKEESVFDLFQFLEQDFYFSPSFSEDSFDPFLLCCAIEIIRDSSGFGIAIFNRIVKKMCPAIAAADFSDTRLSLSPLLTDELSFYAALSVCSIHYNTLPLHLAGFSACYQEEFHFTCEDFVLYDFMNTYFEEKNVLAQPAFLELVDTLSLATLQSFQTDLENFALDGLFFVKHPSGPFSSLYRIAAIDLQHLPTPKEGAVMMKHILSYAVVYELRNNLYDYHLEEEKTITLTNWKTDLKWHYVQYTNVYNLALSSFVCACYTRKLLTQQFQENLRQLTHR